MIEWAEVDPQVFDTYLSQKPAKGRDDIDDALDAVAAGKTVQLTLEDEQKMRGRRMSLGRRAKQRGIALQMRYQENRIIVRQAGTADEEPSEQAEQLEQLEQLEQPATPRAARKRKA